MKKVEVIEEPTEKELDQDESTLQEDLQEDLRDLLFEEDDTYSKRKFVAMKKANETLRTTDIKGKDYVEVNQRIKAFRMVYPTGLIETEMVSNENGICIFRAKIYGDTLLATGTAYEKENSSFINKTSYIENCETSAVGRALGLAGFGIDNSVASAEEVENAIENQDGITLEDAKAIVFTKGKHKDETYGEVLESDPKYLEWLMGNTKSEYTLKATALLLGKELLSEEEEKEKLQLMNELNHFVADNQNVEFEDICKFYKVDSIKDLKLSQIKDAIKKFKNNK